MNGRPRDTIALSSCGVLRWGDVKFSLIHVQIRTERPPLVHLYASSGGTRTDHHLEPGDTFTVADQHWRLDRIERLGDPRGRPEVVLVRVR